MFWLSDADIRDKYDNAGRGKSRRRVDPQPSATNSSMQKNTEVNLAYEEKRRQRPVIRKR